MQEEFLYYLWQFQRFSAELLRAENGSPLEIIDPGLRNPFSGPDFTNAKIVLDGQTWVGNIEIHYSASSWYTHNHHNDPAYRNVILHVVWENDKPVRDHHGSPIHTLSLRRFISPALLKVYHTYFLSKSNKFITCEKVINVVPQNLQQKWLSQMQAEKLHRGFKRIEALALRVNHHWEHLLFLMLARGFGGNINGDVFLTACEKIPFSVIAKLRDRPLQLESLLLGTCGLLESGSLDDPYYHLLRKEFKFLKYKYRLANPTRTKPEFFRLRPLNFPTLRLAQLSALYCEHSNLFRALVLFSNPSRLREILNVKTSPYWDTHYTFGKSSPGIPKPLSSAFINLLIINVLLPLRCYYKKCLRDDDLAEEISMMEAFKPESNSITRRFRALGTTISSAVASQGSVHLYKNYCVKNRCLHCAIGHHVLKVK